MQLEKQPREGHALPNLRDYDREQASFSWEAARRELDGLPGGRGLNIAYEAIGRHVANGHGDQIAIIWLGKKGERQELTYGALDSRSNQFANVLAALGVEPGDRVYSLAGRIPELYLCALGTLKHQAIFCPLFSAFGPEPIAERLQLGEARVLFTTERLYKRRIAAIRDRIPTLEHVIIVPDAKAPRNPEATVDWAQAMAEASAEYEISDTDPDTPALLHFTSGTTGTPKGAYHVHQAVLTHYVTGKLALDLHPGDIYWCTADPGWVTGTSYGISAPLSNRVTMIIDEAEFDPTRWYRILEEEKVQVWYTAPTAIRMLMKAGPELPQSSDLSALRFMASVGEPLNPQAVIWGQEVFGKPFHDNWWQTETGGIMISNYASMAVRPGSMGRPMPGVTAGILREGDDGHLHEVNDPELDGELALRPDWPSLFRGYWNNQERYDACFRDGWYLSGDLARRDEDGYYWFVGRADDVIKSAGHLIGPFEVESVMMKHPAVAEVGVIGKPDPVAGTIIKAFVSLQPGHCWSDELHKELIGFGRKNLGTAAPREIDVIESLPKTRSGKIMRRLLKARELGLPEGDTSTLEGGEKLTLEISRDEALELLRDMIRIRRLEEKSAELYAKQKIRGFLHLYIGEEAVAVGALHALRDDDNIVATYREHGHALIRGIPAGEIMAEMYGKANGCSGGRGGSMHLFSAERRFYGGHAIVGGGLPIAVGLALADKMKGESRVTACFFGDGATDEGEFHESLNLAALWKLPVLFLCENNQYAMGTALDRHVSDSDIANNPPAYGVPADSVNGMDVVAVRRAVHNEAELVRETSKPRFLELKTYRFRAHSMYDAELYRTKEEVEKHKKHDPIEGFQERGLSDGLITQADIDAIEADAAKEVAEAVDFAEQGDWEPVETITRHTYARDLS